MRAAGLVVCLVVCPILACTVEPGSESGSETGGEQAGPDYGSCPLNGDYDCRGTDCAADAEAVPWIALVEDEIAMRGWSERMWVVSGESVPATNQVLISVLQEVGWFRAWMPINGLRTDVNELEFRTDVGLFLNQIELPESVVDHQVLLDAIADCHPDLVYDPCIHHGWSTSIYLNVTYSPAPNCVEELVVFTMDLATGEFVCDLDPPQVGCD